MRLRRSCSEIGIGIEIEVESRLRLPESAGYQASGESAASGPNTVNVLPEPLRPTSTNGHSKRGYVYHCTGTGMLVVANIRF